MKHNNITNNYTQEMTSSTKDDNNSGFINIISESCTINNFANKKQYYEW